MDIEDWERYPGEKEPKASSPSDKYVMVKHRETPPDTPGRYGMINPNGEIEPIEVVASEDDPAGRRVRLPTLNGRELVPYHPFFDRRKFVELEEIDAPEAPPQGRDGRADREDFDGDDPKEGDPGASGDDPGAGVEHGPEPWEGDSDPATEPEPRPEGEGFDVARLVQQDLERRAEMGREKYGERLTTRNGRDPLVDLYQELLDAAVYIRQELQERGQGWTNDPPEEPGYYWMQKIHPETGDRHRKELVYVREYRGALRTHSDSKALPVGRINARWSSRVPEPDEPGRK